jgi:hypothetical protein
MTHSRWQRLFQSFTKAATALAAAAGPDSAFLCGAFLGVIALSEEIGDLSIGQTGARQRRTDFPLSFCAMATRTLGFVGGSAVLRATANWDVTASIGARLSDDA